VLKIKKGDVKMRRQRTLVIAMLVCTLVVGTAWGQSAWDIVNGQATDDGSGARISNSQLHFMATNTDVISEDHVKQTIAVTQDTVYDIEVTANTDYELAADAWWFIVSLTQEPAPGSGEELEVPGIDRIVERTESTNPPPFDGTFEGTWTAPSTGNATLIITCGIWNGGPFDAYVTGISVKAQGSEDELVTESDFSVDDEGTAGDFVGEGEGEVPPLCATVSPANPVVDDEVTVAVFEDGVQIDVFELGFEDPGEVYVAEAEGDEVLTLNGDGTASFTMTQVILDQNWFWVGANGTGEVYAEMDMSDFLVGGNCGGAVEEGAGEEPEAKTTITSSSPFFIEGEEGVLNGPDALEGWSFNGAAIEATEPVVAYTFSPANPTDGQEVTLSATVDGDPAEIYWIEMEAGMDDESAYFYLSPEELYAEIGEDVIESEEGFALVDGSAVFTWDLNLEVDGFFWLFVEVASNECEEMAVASESFEDLAIWTDLYTTGSSAHEFVEGPLAGCYVQDGNDLIIPILVAEHAGLYRATYDDGSGKAIVETDPFHLVLLPAGSELPVTGIFGLGLLLGLGAIGGILRSRKH
jgi:hypothetical protein